MTLPQWIGALVVIRIALVVLILRFFAACKALNEQGGRGE